MNKPTGRQKSNQLLLRAQEYLRQGEPTFCDSHYAHVLSTQEYPEGFDLTYKTAYAKESRQVIVEVDLPSLQAIISAVSTTGDQCRGRQLSARSGRSALEL